MIAATNLRENRLREKWLREKKTTTNKLRAIRAASILVAFGLMTPTNLLAVDESTSSINTEIRIPLEAELHRYMLATESFLKEQNYTQAERYLDKAEALKIELPASFFYFQGIVNNNRHLWPKARVNFEEYILRSSKEDQYYSESLEMITEIENKVPEQLDEKLIKKEISWESTHNPENASTLVEELKALYLTESATNALVTHINTLLASAPFTGKRIISANDTSAALNLSISLTADNRIAVQRTQNQGEGSQIMSFSTSVFGLSRDFMTQCDQLQHKCFIKHKDSLNTWFEIAYDQGVAKEIAEAASALILTMQTEAQN